MNLSSTVARLFPEPLEPPALWHLSLPVGASGVGAVPLSGLACAGRSGGTKLPPTTWKPKLRTDTARVPLVFEQGGSADRKSWIQ